MSTQQEYYDWILDYLKGGLDPQARARMDAALTQDPALAAALDAERKRYLAARMYGPGGLQEQLAALKGTRQPVAYRPYLLAAAAVVLLLLVAGWWYSRPAGAAAILAAAPPDALSAEIERLGRGQGASAADPLLDSLARAMQAYQRQAYDTAATAIEAYLHQRPEGTAPLLYLAAAYLQTGQPEAAGLRLAQLHRADPADEQAALYYAAWLWRYGDRAQARALRDALRQSSDPGIRAQARRRW